MMRGQVAQFGAKDHTGAARVAAVASNGATTSHVNGGPSTQRVGANGQQYLHGFLLPPHGQSQSGNGISGLSTAGNGSAAGGRAGSSTSGNPNSKAASSVDGFGATGGGRNPESGLDTTRGSSGSNSDVRGLPSAKGTSQEAGSSGTGATGDLARTSLKRSITSAQTAAAGGTQARQRYGPEAKHSQQGSPATAHRRISKERKPLKGSLRGSGTDSADYTHSDQGSSNNKCDSVDDGAGRGRPASAAAAAGAGAGMEDDEAGAQATSSFGSGTDFATEFDDGSEDGNGSGSEEDGESGDEGPDPAELIAKVDAVGEGLALLHAKVDRITAVLYGAMRVPVPALSGTRPAK